MIQCRRINKKGFVMQKKFFSFLLTAALLAFPLLADDGAYVVIERTYYEQCKNTFESECYYLYEQAGAEYRAMQGFLQVVQNQNDGYQYQISEADLNITIARGQLDLTDPDQVTVNAQLQAAQASLSALSDTISRNNDTFNSWQNDIHDSMVDFQSHVISVSNSFPYVVSTTNLNIYIIVTNSFEAATNNMCCCTNEFEHFLNYYADVKDQALDLYRATVTNFLDSSILVGVYNRSYWDALSSQYQDYFNIGWKNAPLPFSPNVAFGNLSGWNGHYYYTRYPWLDDDLSLRDFTLFTFQGIHDSVNQLAFDLDRSVMVLMDAMTNTTFSLAMVNSKTNEFTQFLSMPQSYPEQAAKVAKSRNWFQRIELWLSSIARNTAPLELGDESDQDSEQDIMNVIETATNEISVASIGIKESFIQTLPDLTNTTVALQGAVTSVSRILDSFKSSGGNRSSSSVPSSFNLMKTEFINTTFTRLGIQESEDMPYYIGADVDTDGFEDVQTAATWIHHIFGFIWLSSGIALLVFYARWLSSWVVTIWYRLLGMLVKVSKFTWGGS